MNPEIATLASPATSPAAGPAPGRVPGAARHASHARFWLAVCAVMLALIGLVMITAGVVTAQPGLVLVATMSTIAGGASMASAYSVHRKSLR
ncbi:hypothetical protein AB0K08_05755 [Citricoccus sp. NPDC055426]|uniref:hypothetical protein n=1 Tax=Citricoccus sp. NPDC055426 TaxID=3155536 RepID=UPI003419B806